MKALAVRVAHAEDALPIAQIHVDTWQAAYPGLVPDDYLVKLSVADEAMAWARQLSLPPGPSSVLVAERDKSVVGFVSIGPNRHAGFQHAGEVYALYVDIDWQNQGIGKRLMAAAFEKFWERGVESALVWVLAGNPSRFFYEALGGKLAGRRAESFAGVVLDEIGYGWENLGAGLERGKTRGGPLDSPRSRL